MRQVQKTPLHVAFRRFYLQKRAQLFLNLCVEHVADTSVMSQASRSHTQPTEETLAARRDGAVTGVCVTHDHVRMGRRTEHSVLHTHTHKSQTIHTVNASCLPLIRAQFSGRQDTLVVGGERERASISRLLTNLPAGKEKHGFISGLRFW